MKSPEKKNNFRYEIQGLRAIAVVSVVLFHVWPEFFPGGYVGVDVFFVISGYLITGLLVRELEKSGTILLSDFYIRRIKRLLPAAMFVLLVVLALFPLLPTATWGDSAIEIVASALYVENWRLAWLSVDYLGAENTPSPVQHYWSLSIEEQFYLAWPAMILIGAYFSRKLSLNFKPVLIGLISAITIASLALSIYITEKTPEIAYFATHTRAWELGIGAIWALLAFKIRNAVIRNLVAVLGFIGVVAPVFVYSGETSFPGSAALVPTMGALFLIIAGEGKAEFWGRSFLDSRASQYVGSTSYSQYLIHWPLIIVFLIWKGGHPTILEGVLLIAANFILADYSKRYLEDFFVRQKEYQGLYLIQPVRFTVLSITLCIAGSSGFYFASHGIFHGGSEKPKKHAYWRYGLDGEDAQL